MRLDSNRRLYVKKYNLSVQFLLTSARWFKGNIEGYRGFQQLGEDWGLYVSEKEPVSNVSNVSTFFAIKQCLY